MEPLQPHSELSVRLLGYRGVKCCAGLFLPFHRSRRQYLAIGEWFADPDLQVCSTYLGRGVPTKCSDSFPSLPCAQLTAVSVKSAS